MFCERLFRFIRLPWRKTFDENKTKTEQQTHKICYDYISGKRTCASDEETPAHQVAYGVFEY